MYYNICPYCGSHLDPEERCNCDDISETKSNTRSLSPLQRAVRRNNIRIEREKQKRLEQIIARQNA